MNKLELSSEYYKCRLLLGLVFTLDILLGLSACATIPQQEFDVYRSNFNTAKASAQDIILRAKVAAETVAKSPHNPVGPNVRQKKLTERTAALDARLQALELIAEFNEVLVSLTSGARPAAVRGSLEALRDSLSSFGISRIRMLAEKATPLFGVISHAVAVIDDLIRQNKFKEAVDAAQEPIIGIIEILQKDADQIHEIEVQLIMLEQDEVYIQITKLKKRLKSLVDTYKKSNELDKLISEYNNLILQLEKEDQDKKTLKIEHNPRATAFINPVEVETMRSLVDQVAQNVKIYKKLGEQVNAHQTVINEYKNLLTGTRDAFINLNTAVRSNYRTATVAYVIYALNLRKAILEYQEAKLK